MKLVSWNVNGLRACITKGFYEYFDRIDADFFCLQELKLQEGQLDWNREGYYAYWNYAEKKGYSGTAIFTKIKPLHIFYDITSEPFGSNMEYDALMEQHNHEGRVITLEYDQYYIVTVYTPNSKTELERLEYRMIWEDGFRGYLLKLNNIKPVIVCGDMNVAHKEIDIKNPTTNHHSAGFTDEERNKMTELLNSGFTDSFRDVHPDKRDVYSWWSYRFKARERNTGWRIDYFLVSDKLKSNIINVDIHTEVLGSDHCPVELDIDI